MAIHYATASIKRHQMTSERREVYLSWTTTRSTEFNRLKFCLTSRYREYLKNIDPAEIEAWPQHQYIVSLAKETEPCAWIGKGMEVSKFIPRALPRSLRVNQTGALLDYDCDTDSYNLNIWLGPHNLSFRMLPTLNNKHYSYQGSDYFSNQTQTSLTTSLRPDQL